MTAGLNVAQSVALVLIDAAGENENGCGVELPAVEPVTWAVEVGGVVGSAILAVVTLLLAQASTSSR